MLLAGLLTGARVNNIRYVFILTGFMAANCFATANEASIRNDLKGCVDLQPGQTEQVGNLVVLNAKITINKSIADCGCKSALVTYRSYTKQEWGNRLLQSGVFGLRESTETKFVLASEKKLLSSGPTILEISCSSPE
ncbi:MAG: DUF2195 family protein [Methylococcaceae bacterium]|nr:DUF2195 family protein [Methylococcaceae bacterium]